MGDRALVVFKTKDNDVSPVVYLHWHGHCVGDWIAELKTLMQGRDGDVGYAAARFVGICHGKITGNSSLGIIDDGRSVVKDPEKHSHGDHGVIIVSADDFSFEQFGEYPGCKLGGRSN